MIELSLDDIRFAMDDHLAPSFAAIGSPATSSAIQAAVWTDDVAFERAIGLAQFSPDRPVDITTPFDLASVSKVFTATLVMIGIDEGLCELQSPISDWFDEWDDQNFRPVTLLDLMNHSSGLRAWEQYYLRYPIQPDVQTAQATADAIEAEIFAEDRGEPGVRGVYSDLGYILLGRTIERIFDEPLEDLVDARIAQPLELESVRHVSLRRGDEPLSDAAATELDPRRGGFVVGVVHDENCFIQGGVAGHAGLFGTARDVAAFGWHMLEVDRGASGIVSSQTLHRCWDASTRGGDGHHLAGWDTPSGEESSAGRGFNPKHTVGHLGFTGTSLWIERNAGVVAALLTNRVYPTRENDRIKPLRVAFHEAVIPPDA